MMAYGNETLFVSKDHNLQADVYMESDAEEIYMPDGTGRQFGKKKRISTTTEDDSGIVGYQKYLHIVNRLAMDNTDGIEPNQPQLSQFLRVSAAEEEQEMSNQLQNFASMQTQTELENMRVNNQSFVQSLLERTDEDSLEDSEYGDEVDEAEEERMKKFSKFNFSGMSFKDYVGEVKKSVRLKKEMQTMVQTFTEQKLKRHHGVHLS